MIQDFIFPSLSCSFSLFSKQKRAWGGWCLIPIRVLSLEISPVTRLVGQSLRSQGLNTRWTPVGKEQPCSVPQAWEAVVKATRGVLQPRAALWMEVSFMWWFGRDKITYLAILGWNKGENEKRGGDKAKNEDYVPWWLMVACSLSLP